MSQTGETKGGEPSAEELPNVKKILETKEQLVKVTKKLDGIENQLDEMLTLLLEALRDSTFDPKKTESEIEKDHIQDLSNNGKDVIDHLNSMVRKLDGVDREIKRIVEPWGPPRLQRMITQRQRRGKEPRVHSEAFLTPNPSG